MRLWSLHPGYLDPQGLVALWREALLAQAVLAGATKGYRHHPQLLRFSAHATPLRAVGTYLRFVVQEAQVRGYSFDRSRILEPGSRIRLPVSRGQLEHEFIHLRTKLLARSPAWLASVSTFGQAHPMFRVVPGEVAPWERVGGD